MIWSIIKEWWPWVFSALLAFYVITRCVSLWPFHKPKPETQIRILTRDIRKLRLSEWRADKNLCAAAAKALTDPTFGLMLSVLENESPANIAFRPDASLETLALDRACIKGYMMCIANLEAMGKHQELETNIEPTFEMEEKPIDL